MRRWMGGSYVGDSDECVIREIDLSSIDKTKPTTVVFGEVIGYGPAYMNKYDRAFYYGEDITNVSSGSWNDAEWVPFQWARFRGRRLVRCQLECWKRTTTRLYKNNKFKFYFW